MWRGYVLLVEAVHARTHKSTRRLEFSPPDIREQNNAASQPPRVHKPARIPATERDRLQRLVVYALCFGTVVYELYFRRRMYDTARTVSHTGH